ncbi:RpiB/LacA/LacB family sugar-phosphate isomerase [Metamycoplasma hyosynoviae]|uniref:RpiB/LacA/LacB family sugar-phosphate isomerase n=1 Tax=Metamycoplasma hyosynoviae TaxID=29559 RepID=UPI002358E2D2|nr:RpiB/LacA/LacB family sugar-phosphate isomerase [Metamycoplasma hyosynoviae]MDC8900848.1 RpiB/LacA/LacB family sugar-phosphate isomerase [Metamycoplasma hyosynoviae]MDC8912469.1 RpiB/LacA/LacB family sugar-phosphate isomerase [Metamycoplasma hyosynoviae]MDC8912882.1 RpiB/LacA/LacB family sugar-phosphate isomerase [Metamycoplasma hyosynoviae]MDC8915020.1 RpiB/LacA/LacB family sugar-phosphate isomerase [Metamycoplasma hyosynoviae]MDD1374949.1 RpiB/LacA/LacB family sugar-phosphate isomerase [M
MKKTIYITSDHGGHSTKTKIIELLKQEGYEVKNFGSQDEEKKLSYAEVGLEFANIFKKESRNSNNLFIALCGSGIGISIALNRFKQIRCARVTSEEEAKLAKLHNNANILCFGGRLMSAEEAIKLFHIWETTEYEGGRHESRIKVLSEHGE